MENNDRFVMVRGRKILVQTPADLNVFLPVPLKDTENSTPVHGIQSVIITAKSRYGVSFEFATMSLQTLEGIAASSELKLIMKYSAVTDNCEFLAYLMGLKIVIADEPDGIIRMASKPFDNDAMIFEAIINAGPLPELQTARNGE